MSRTYLSGPYNREKDHQRRQLDLLLSSRPVISDVTPEQQELSQRLYQESHAQGEAKGDIPCAKKAWQRRKGCKKLNGNLS